MSWDLALELVMAVVVSEVQEIAAPSVDSAAPSVDSVPS